MPVALDEPFHVIGRDESRDLERGVGARSVKRSSHRHCFFSVRMKRSITLLHCGSPANDGECSMPKVRP
jgi:hypothetical protein